MRHCSITLFFIVCCWNIIYIVVAAIFRHNMLQPLMSVQFRVQRRRKQDPRNRRVTLNMRWKWIGNVPGVAGNQQFLFDPAEAAERWGRTPMNDQLSDATLRNTESEVFLQLYFHLQPNVKHTHTHTLFTPFPPSVSITLQVHCLLQLTL